MNEIIDNDYYLKDYKVLFRDMLMKRCMKYKAEYKRIDVMIYLYFTEIKWRFN